MNLNPIFKISPYIIITLIFLFANVGRAEANVQTWTGANSGNWSDPANWSGGVPTLADTVIIPSPLAFYPVLSASSYAKSISMALGSSLTTSNYPLKVVDSITGFGIITANSSNLYVGGNFNASVFTGNTSNDTVGGDFNVPGAFTAGSATIYVYGTLAVGGTFTGGTAVVTVNRDFTVGTAFTGGTATVKIKRNFIIGTTFTGGSSHVDVAGDFYLGTSFTGGGSVFTFNGTTAQSMGGGGISITYDILYISNPVAAVSTTINITATNITVRDSSVLIPGVLNTVGGVLADSGTIQVTMVGNTDDLASQYTGTLTLSTGTVDFTGASGQTLGLADIKNLTINNTSAGVTLSGLVTVREQLALITGGVTLGSNKLTMGLAGNITGYNSTKFVKTNGTGVLEMLASHSGGTLFPIGDAYNPITIRPTTDAFFDAGVADGITDSLAIPRTTHAVDVTWAVQLVSGNQNVVVTPQWNGNEELPLFDRTISFVETRTSQAAGVPDAIWVGTAAPAAASGSDPYILVSGSVPMSSGTANYFAVSDSVSSLPVTLLYFNAKRVDNVAELKWATASEINNNYFNIERSVDGRNWVKTGMMNGHGNSLITEKYSFQDNSDAIILNKTIYYRLKQVDFNGAFTYSEIKAISYSGSTTLVNAYPNPTSGQLNVKWTNTENQVAVVKLLDLSGKILFTQQIEGKGVMNMQIDLSGKPAGTYILQTVVGKETQSLSVFKN